jgi:hypothetical protein
MYKEQWSDTFEAYMRNRMVVGGYRYGRIQDPQSGVYDNIGSLIDRAKAYLEDGNQEHLVDAANLAMVEFMRGSCHANPHWSPTDDGSHTPEAVVNGPRGCLTEIERLQSHVASLKAAWPHAPDCYTQWCESCSTNIRRRPDKPCITESHKPYPCTCDRKEQIAKTEVSNV